MMMKPTHKTHDLRARLREHVPLEPEHELHAQSLALLAEIEAALDEADVKSGCAVLCGDSLDVLKTLPDNSVHAVVTDPPYGLGDTSPAQVADCMLAWARGETWTPKGSGFMGKFWDAWVPPPELWREVLRVLKPGGHALVFAGSRTQDLMSLSLRLAGFEIRDTLQWLYGSGFPKSHNVSKALDKQAGEVDDSWQGWGTALKPAYEPVIMARKSLKGTVVQNTLEHGCGGINVDACRVAWSEGEEAGDTHAGSPAGRWPANVILDPEAGALLDTQASEPVSRFFYCAKASRAEREAGLQGHETKTGAQLTGRQEGSVGLSAYAGTRGAQPRANIHPTVKPINLMRYLVRLVTPSHGTVLDPFTGSGSTGCAAVLERVNFIGIERETEYARIARARIAHHMHQDADIDQDDLFSALDEADEKAKTTNKETANE
jgi:site-specific DNA-methyltransferase (adenine-specific)